MELLSQLGEAVGAHWPFVATALIFATVGQVLKAAVWTQRNFLRWRVDEPNAVLWRVFWWGRKTLPLHPVGAGALLGLVPAMPTSAGVDSTSGSVLYFAFAGVASTWVFATLKAAAKRKGLDLTFGTRQQE